MGPEDLAQVLSGLPDITDPRVLVGTKTADDAAVYRVSDTLAIIQTLDFFTPVVDDPYWFGAIAAANSLSDVYAMGGKPAFALNIVGFPRKSESLPLSVLGEILHGGADKAQEAGINIVGGHSVDDNEPKYGLVVTGFVHPDRIWKNVGAHAGDRLVLTKPLGSGIITTAMKSATASVEAESEVIRVMSTLNAAAAEVGRELGNCIHACTDVTGFGLLGHLREMLSEGDLGARLHLSAIPIIESALDYARQGIVPGGTVRNRESVENQVVWPDSVPEECRIILCDAQTSGGLLFAVDHKEAAGLIARLQDSDALAAAEIGEIIADGNGQVGFAD